MNSSIFRRGQIWMVDFGTPVGSELGFEHPAVIVSNSALINTWSACLICVPGTSTRYENPRTKMLISAHLEVNQSDRNGLSHSTYFMSEKVHTLSFLRFRRLMGNLEIHYFKELEERLCLAMDLLALAN